MKKIITVVFMVALTTAAMAQQGSWYIGGAVGFSSSKDEPPGGGAETVNTNWAFSPEVGTFLTNDIQLGAALGFSGGKTEVDGDKVFKTSAISPTVYGRKFFRLTDNFSTFAGLYLSLINEKDVDYGPTVESTSKGFGARVGVGIAYSLSPKFTAVGQYGLMGFESVKNEVDGADAGTETNFDFGVNTVGGSVFNIGIYYTFMGGK